MKMKRLKIFLSELNEPGTLFLDEVWGLSLHLQGRLWQPLKRDAKRLITSSSMPLIERIDSSEFRKDLYYRLNVLDLPLPSLSERRSDIPLLVHHF
ncbi:sigma 54-interacting transcriptional regulator [Bacillus licheniformis]|nr:sigma 54-interacting transcriptional regulator [Bacillus licheniformis]